MEDDFPFSFGIGSDEDQEFEGLFCAPKKPKTGSSKTEALAVQELYCAQIDQDGWFRHTDKSIQELMQNDKNGATKVKMRADHCYMLHQYREAYTIAQEYCRVIAENSANPESGAGESHRSGSQLGTGAAAPMLKVTDSREMQEMALRCALKLNLFQEGARIADDSTLQDIGSIFLKAKAFMNVGRYNDAALRLVQYQKTRSSNYSVWRILGECFLSSFHASGIPEVLLSSGSENALSCISSQLPFTSRIFATLALMCMLRARHLMRSSTWTNVDYSQVRYRREMGIIDAHISGLETECGLECSAIGDQTSRPDSGLQFVLQQYDLKVVGPAQACLKSLSHSPEQTVGLFALEVIEYVVTSWDPQVLEPSGPRTTADREECHSDPEESSMRNK
ncbi:hypothetical protein EDD11_001683 [Mortierella claussenii]|nr:hypothetical protein EDD11_001683 [Mortierella claussenii]